MASFIAPRAITMARALTIARGSVMPLRGIGVRAVFAQPRRWLSTEMQMDQPVTILRTRKPPRQRGQQSDTKSELALKRREAQLEHMAEKIAHIHATAPPRKFDETLDVAIHLNVDPKRSDQRVRGMITLPHGTGKSVAVAVFTKDEAQAQAARAAGADLVGAEELVAQVKDGTIAFERALATPDAMPVLSQVARILGPKGLMPSPKRGTVLSDVADAVREAKAGQVEYAADRNAVVHVPFGKRSFELHKLQANLHVLVTAVLKARPDQYQRKPPKSLFISTSMGPSVRLEAKLF